MADGIATIEINEQRIGRLKELNWLDFRLEDVCFDDSEGMSQILAQLPNDPKNVLVLVVFDYVCHCSRDFEGNYDCDDFFTIVSHQILKTDYKEFYREMITEELNIGIKGFENIDCIPENVTFEDGNYYKELVSNWEEFYDEDFKPYSKQSKNIQNVLSLQWNEHR